MVILCERETTRLGAAMALLLATCAASCAQKSAPKDAPNIVFISIDSLRADHLGCYGYPKPTSPTIDALAAQGARFEWAISTTSWTLPSHAAMFTGLYDSAHGLVDNALALAAEHRTLAEVLADHGYRTGGFFGGPYLHPVFGLGQGFETYESCMAELDTKATEASVRDQSRLKHNASHSDVTSPRTLAAATRWLDSLDRARPFFLFLHLWDVHYDFLPPKELVELFDPGYTGTLTGENFMDNPAVRAGMDPRDLMHLLALYDGEIRFVDNHLSQLVTVLKERGEWDNTLFVITADHGEEFFEHGQKGHQKSLFDEVVHVPLVLSWPARIRTGVRVSDPVRIIDLMPTLLTAAGVARRPKMQGRDLWPLIIGESLPFEPALCELLVDKREYRAVRTGGFKVIQTHPSKALAGFDLASDPKETIAKQILAPDPRVVSGGRVLQVETERAREWLRGLGAGPEEIEIDPAMLEKLQSLGYVDKDK